MTDKALKKAGLKVTLPRVKILKILENADPHHMSAEDVYRKLMSMGEEVGLATVYRVLTQFELAGLVKRHHFESGYCVFEINQGSDHHHLICVHCHQVEEFVDDLIEQRQLAITKKLGFEITGHNLTIYGVCRRCKEKK